MSYRSYTIASVIKLLNVRYFLPAIQREYVWEPQQVLLLFDSIFSDYPTGSLLFWQLDEENHSKYPVYKFIDEFKQGGTRNQPVNTEGKNELTLVIDGQQRLTSLLIGLTGAYIIKKKGARKNSVDAWTKHYLYLDLLKTPDEDGNANEKDLRYGFEFHKEKPTDSKGCHWFPVSNIMKYDSEKNFKEFLKSLTENLPKSYTRGEEYTIRENLERLYQMVWKDNAISYYTETQQDYERVLDIFIRANDSGTKLTKSDLLMSVITLHWEDINAREAISDYVDRLNYRPKHRNNFDKDFLMKTCFVVCDLPITYSVSSFTSNNLAVLQENWERLKKAIEGAVDLANQFGIDGQNLTSKNALIPIIYFLYHNPGRTLQASTPYDTRNAAIVRRWLIMMLLNRVFGSLGDNVQKEARLVLQDFKNHDADFPAETINKALQRAGKSPSFDENEVERFLDIRYNSRECFLALSLLYEEKAWGMVDFHVDHIFPRSFFQSGQAGYDKLYNRVGNLQLLPATENMGKSDQDFGTWLKTRDSSFRERHLIPNEDRLLDIGCFEEFIEAREKLIRDRLSKILSV